MAGDYPAESRCWFVEMGDLAVDHAADVAREYAARRKPLAGRCWPAYVAGLQDGERCYRKAGLGLLAGRMRRLLKLVAASDGHVLVEWFAGLVSNRATSKG